MAQIDKPNLYFNTKLYSGTGSSNAVTGVGFQPDWTWIKKRNGTNYHVATDAVRLATKQIYPNSTGPEETVAEGLKSFDSDGFTLGTNGDTNGSGGNYVGWNWKANGAGSANTDGDINSTVSVSQTAGFSIVKYTSGGGGQTVGHGLGAVPKMMIAKRLGGNGYDWVVYHQNDTAGLYLNGNGKDYDGSSSNIWFNGSAPTSSVFTCGSDGRMTGSGVDFIVYCFAEIKGYSKFGNYKGNGNANGTFIYTGFKPAFVLLKDGTSIASWLIYDNKRDVDNVASHRLYTNATDAEDSDTSSAIDLLSNGFKCRTSDNSTNKSGAGFIYMAFAENPIVGSNKTPATAR